MKQTIYFLLLTVIGMASSAQTSTNQRITIRGTVSGDTKGFNKIYTSHGNGGQDSIEIKDGKFTMTVPFNAPFSQFFYTEYEISGERRNRGYRPTSLLFDRPGLVEIDLDIEKGFSKANIRGSKSTILFNDFLKKQSDINQIVRDQVEKRFGKTETGTARPASAAPAATSGSARGITDTKTTAAVAGSPQTPVALSKQAYAGSVAPSKPGTQGKDPMMLAGDSLFRKYMTAMMTEFVQNNPDEFTSAYIVDRYMKSSVTVEQLQKIYASLSSRMQNSQEGMNTLSYINGLKDASTGAAVKSFSLPDRNEKIFNFDQLKGKYVWIDFWASWCGPCKAAFPHMQTLYAKYKSRNLEILGISNDETKAPWLKALNQFKNPWMQIIDEKSAVSSQFAVTALPTSILIGPDGKIIIREVGFNPNGEFAKKLEELFGK